MQPNPIAWGAVLATLLHLPAIAQPQGTLEKVKASGAIVLGVREASAPLSYLLGSSQYVGYHVELCERIAKNLFPQAQVRYQAVTSQNRMPLVQNGTVDLECGSTSNTASRKEQVDFANTTYITEARYAVKKSSGIESTGQLAGKTIVTTTGTTLVPRLRKLEREGLKFNLVMAKDHAESMLMVAQGRADAFAMDDNTLAGNIAMLQNPQDFRIVGTPLGREPIALMLRRNDAAFKQAVDAEISKLIRSGELRAMYDKWFMSPIPPANVSLNLPFPPSLETAFSQPNSDPAEAYAMP
ncbi:amino acid ABC transporter substrate-binding protein [Alicycliphilus denitrificans]|uniref:ABC-type transporter, periplasmic subunit family 3 n=2 Tax=Alicycliphilus denitrificans TaxID=179636 RepID=F4GDT5_ALIDK|nr:amino acid ABC transporter substrate-binding protein [Alicycliphilus denitrificans]ADV00821.1 extracellular solute-binding protein family 3 [Alicycliphilus denitrificans BC]AEB83752.1 ABC-type transporter, periplasmic subunit family 3 [Alicycliphilus denitrificans K601]QKD44982.1 amino acid ABC transporter substrate-binding protein [Alicycliphilus denitrificans]GAO24400.1 ABC transporter substrate-binding protein [Alicycliphilus sp. B1]